VLALAAATLGPTMLAGAASGDHLTVSVTGNGNVTDATGAISCPPKCEADIPHATFVELTETPNGNDTFQGWSGPCTGAASKCGFDMNGAVTVGAAFTGTGPEPTPSPTPSPSPSATPTPQPTATPTPAPSPSPSPGLIRLFLGVGAAPRQSLHLTHGRVRLRLRCSRVCNATVHGTIHVPHITGKMSLKTVKRTLPAGTWIGVGVRLSPAVRAAVRNHATRRHPAVTHLTIGAAAPATKGASATRTVRLIP
jgi:hypothetical protein